jgi:hypothetical protein
MSALSALGCLVPIAVAGAGALTLRYVVALLGLVFTLRRARIADRPLIFSAFVVALLSPRAQRRG